MLRTNVVIVGVCLLGMLSSSQSVETQGNARAAIEAANKKFSAAYASGKAGDVAAMYTADAVAFPPNSDVVKGRDGLQKLWQGMIDSGAKAVDLTTTEVEAHGDTAHEAGTYSVKDAAGKVVDHGKYIVIWKQQQGQWKLHRDIWNTSMPAGK
jgi:uncharacterized protein (TIGR02246 family)